MPTFDHILFPVDFSDRCRTTLPFVKSYAQRFDAKVTLLHSVPDPSIQYGGFEGGFPMVIDIEAMTNKAQKNLDSFLDTSELGADRVVTTGEAAAEIVRFADDNNVGLIMLPTHGYGKFRTMLLGSTTAKVLHDAKCPVWTAAHTEDPVVAKHSECNRIIAAVDLTPTSVDLIRRYVSLADEFKATLMLLHAVPDAAAGLHGGGAPQAQIPEYGIDREFQGYLLRWAREELARLQAEARTNLEVCIEGGAISKVVRKAVVQHDADLVLIGRDTLHKKFGQLRTNTYAIIRDAPCPVLSV